MEAYDLFSKTLTVSEANSLIHRTIEEIFYELTIEGEISGFRPASSGHWYFTLKDSSAAIDAAVFRSFQPSMIMPEDGDLVVATGALSYYEKSGKITFVVREMKKKGEGGIMEMIEKRKAYYRSLGYFDDDKKKPIPEEIRTLGVVTSFTGAAIHDILNVTKRRAPSLDILIFPTAVQGENAAEGIASRIRQANLFAACDLLIVGRGGGSTEDLLAFSEPEVIEAIWQSEIPVISAVGHDVDWPISDYVADRRAPTPSAAAEIATETIFRRRERLGNALLLSRSNIESKIHSAEMRLQSCIKGLSEYEKRILRIGARIPSTKDLGRLLWLRVQNSAQRLAFAEESIIDSMEKRIKAVSLILVHENERMAAAISAKRANAETRIEIIAAESSRIIQERLSKNRALLDSLIKETEALSPLEILKRGYSVTYGEDGKILTAASAKAGERITTRMKDGTIASIVEE